ncbi:ABC transporter ATP-binding protein [Arthrobacter sp. TB 23]|uniref:ABC transporter ATP-binding protein n=1 Tax=Arthrobacter sp. TB 23 TaxID=494419 RepID=UPI0002FE6B65|nr:ABC transporter ATP-binding protein [Arthrobacter sp. TB 23]
MKQSTASSRTETPGSSPPTDPASAVVVDSLTKSYRQPKKGDLVAVDKLSLTIETGETYALLGPNGAGKSTTIEILEGHRKPTSGTVTVLGQNPYKAPALFRSRIGIVLQEATDMGTLKVAEALKDAAALYPNPRRVDEVMVAVGIEEKAGALIKSLSGGQRRRVDVALGMIGNPELLFLDEPTTGFDPAARRRFWDLIRGLGKDGTTIVLTTHYLDEAQHLSDRLGIIASGRVIATGTADSVGGPDLRIPRVRWRDDDGQHEKATTSPGALIHQLTEGGSWEPTDLEVIRPSLEDVYLELLRQHDADTVTTTTADPLTSPEGVQA